MTMTPLRAARTLLLASAVIFPVTAYADEAPDSGSGEIVVTARYRDESLQQVPIAITAVSGESLNDRAIHNLQDLSATVPSVDFRNGASNKDRTVFIRGVGTISTSPGVESSVSTVLDGVVLTRPGQATLDVGEVSRIEVLRGPQGTLFGKNASAGVISVVTAAPSQEFHAYAEGTATTDEEYRIKAGVTGGIAPNVAARIDGLYANYDGNVHNVATGNQVNGYERYGARAKIEATPTDNLKLTLAGDYLYSHDTTPSGVYANTNQIQYPTGAITASPALAAFLAGQGIAAGPENRKVSTDFDTDVRDRNYGGSLTAEWGLGDYTVTSITAYREWKNRQHQDYDALSQLSATFPEGDDRGTVDNSQFSQELRLTSPKGKLIDYVVGAYYLHAKTDEVYTRSLTRLISGAENVVTGVANYGVKSDNYALFGEANINFTPWLRAIAGYRSTWDDLSYYHVRTSSNDPTNSGAPALDVAGIRAYHNSAGSTSTRGDSYRGGLQLDFAANNQAYFTYSRGYKGPAYNAYFNMRSLNATTPLDEIALKPETSDSFEGGVKGSALGNQITYALAVYSTKFHNYQANYNDVVGGAQVTRLINAGTVQTKGVELDFGLRPIRGLSLDTSVAYTDAKVLNFICPPGAPASCDINGQVLPFAPKWKLYSNAAYRFALSDSLDLEVQSDITLKSRTQYQLAQTPGTIQPGYYIWNASVALIGTTGDWQLRGFVKNITNQSYSNFLANGTLAGIVRYVPRDDKRYAGIMLRKDF
ncbi:TonB-dependent receptor [Novosphingobium sp. TCA1]|uniref:TonB-dependent receptor n=1 Tax=Novosphingobium sp. TCA1 TaxID=2682474 RepID=UPI00130837EF|nr:TonB-dependent receptor [Novosphingobium sp. TCA1]GFE75239.1 TonB-dependent receptor [Novosphingobium sp. TCA1]